MDVDGEECQVKHRRKLVAGVRTMVEMADSGLLVLVLYGTLSTWYTNSADADSDGKPLQDYIQTERHQILWFMMFYTSKLKLILS